MNLYGKIKYLKEAEKEIDSMSYEEVEDEIDKVKAELDYCDRRDEVCASFGGDQQRYELKDRLAKLEKKLDSFDYEYNDGDTNWAAEEEADALERMEKRYGGIEESKLQEDDNNWFKGEEGLKDWLKEKCHFDCDTYLREEDQDKLNKAWNLLWNIAQSYAKPLSKFKVHTSVGDKDIVLDITNSGGIGGLVFRITFPDPYNGVNAFKGVSAVVHGDQNFTEDWYELTQAVSHIVLK